MTSALRVAGFITIQIDGEIQNAAGDFEYNLGSPKRSTLVGPDGVVHGFKEEGQAPMIKGTVRDRRTLDVQRMTLMDDVTVTLQLANGKVIVVRNAWFAGDGNASTAEATVDVEFHGKSAEEIR